MGARDVSVVADAGPLIHLAEINCLRLLAVFETIHISGAVWSETVGRDRVSQNDLLDLRTVQRHVLPQSEVAHFVKENNFGDLHAGEQECLCLCWRKNIPSLLTDDLAVRDAANRLSLKPVGSLGIVVRAYQRRHISLARAEQHINDLYTVSSLFVTQAIVELAIEQIRKYSESWNP